MSIEELAPKAYRSFQTILAKERLNHAYLFAGDFANFEMALYLTQAIFCQDLKDKLPCGRCRSCQLIAKNEFQDLTVLEPSGQVIKTETIREMLKDFSRTGYEGEQQVFIIKDCEKMHINAANALLKHIEEPQSASYIFLLTNDDNQVLPTIKSRTQIFHFPKSEDYLSRQAQKAGLLKNQADLIAKLAKSPDDLEKLIKDSKVLDFINTSQKLTTYLLSNREKAYLEVSRLATSALDKKEQDMVLKLIIYHLANDYSQAKAIHYLEGLYLARQMWESNVSFQNALEYMVLS